MSVLQTLQLVKDAPVQLKAMKSMQGRDGVAWSANIYQGSKKVGDVRDECNGGPIWVNVPEDLSKTLVELGAAMSGSDFEADGTYLASLADADESYRKIKRKAAKQLLFIPATEKEEDSYRCLNNPDSPQAREWVVLKFGVDTIFLNDYV